MNDIWPRQVTHRGNVYASGFIIQYELARPAEARRRVFTAWQPNSKVYRIEEGLVLVLPEPLLVSVEETIGLALVSNEGVLAGCPLSEKEVAGLSGSLAQVRSGKLVCLRLADLSAEVMEDWIGVDALQFEQGVSLGDAPLKPSPIAEPVVSDIRETLKGIPKPSAELVGFLASLEGNAAGRKNPRGRISFAQVIAFLRSLIRPGVGSQQPTVTASRFALWLDAVANQLTQVMRLSKVIGWRQARYLTEVMKMFEAGDVTNALRHAIPLSSISESPQLKTYFGVPTARQSLQIRPWQRSAPSRMAIAGPLYNHLEGLYRETFRRLEAQGRIDEAAFVLAELLHAHEEAVAFLERHRRFREAAEIAEARGLPPDLVVRQWYIAGEKERAIQIARKTGAFFGAVSRLDKSRHPLAAALRRDWAQTLADAGDPAAAVDVLWPLQSDRALALGWMKEAVDLGGTAAARNLARLLAISVTEFEAYRDRALALLRSDSVEDAASRIDFAKTLCAQPRSTRTETIARAAVRASMIDIGLGLDSLSSKALRQLIDYSNDGALRSDLPRGVVRRRADLQESGPPVQHVVKAPNGGAIPSAEVAPLPAGGYVVALGEAGLKLVTRDGRMITHVDQPAFQLAISHNGARVIAVAPRSKLSMISRFEVATRKAMSWCLTELDAFTKTFDGDTWYIASGQDLYAIDATSPKFDALWRIPDVGVPAGPLTLTSSTLCFVTKHDNRFCLWEYRHPNLRLASKTFFESLPSETPEPQFSACDNGAVLFSSASHDTVFFQAPGRVWEKLVKFSEGEHLSSLPTVTEHWIGLVVRAPDHARVLMYSIAKPILPILRLEVLLEGEVQPSVRIDNSRLTVACNGSAQTYDLTYGSRILSLRY